MYLIGPEEPDEKPAIRELVVAAFGRPDEAAIVEALWANNHAIVSLAARDSGPHARQQGEIVGHVMFSPVVIERDGLVVARGVGLGPLAVLPAKQRGGIGSLLSRLGLERCKQIGQPWCVVLGDPAYYSRFGFERASEYGIENEFGANNAFGIIALAGPLPSGGLARYGAEFHT